MKLKRYKKFFPIILFLALNSTSVVADPIPKKLHFIWVGKNISEEYINNIKSFAAKNPDYEINLWLDKIFHFERTFSQMDSPQFKFNLRDIHKIRQKMDFLTDSFLQREMSGVYPNFAAASDILRLYILDQEGGIYIDTDLKPVSDKLASFGTLDAKYGFLANIHVNDSESGLDRWTLNNNIIAASPGSQILTILKTKLLNRYRSEWELVLTEKRKPGCKNTPFSKTKRFKATLYLSGPDLTASGLLSVGLTQKLSKADLNPCIKSFDWLPKFAFPVEVLASIVDKCDNNWNIRRSNKEFKSAEFEDLDFPVGKDFENVVADLHGRELTDEQFYDLFYKKTGQFSMAEKVNLIGTKFSKKLLAFLPTSLTTLEISDIGDDEMGLIVARCPNLRSLVIRVGSVGDRGAEIISKNLPNLLFLDLYKNEVRENGAIMLAEHLPKLMHLNLAWNRIYDYNLLRLIHRKLKASDAEFFCESSDINKGK